MNYYFHANPETINFLSPEESAHAIKVLRKKEGDELWIVDGIGALYKARISSADFRKCQFEVLSKQEFPKKDYSVHVAIAPTKNMDRLEWFVEKTCELGIDEISLIETTRTERSKVNLGRLEKKTISALKQSKSFWKCKVNAPIKFQNFIKSNLSEEQKFIAYVDSQNPQQLAKEIRAKKDTLVLIGPEGDFTNEEVEMAVQGGFEKVGLGDNVLRTETAGVAVVNTILVINII